MITVSLDSGDIDAALRGRLPPDLNVTYRGGLFQFDYRLPLGSAKGVAVGSFRGSDVVLSVPFRRITASLVGPLAGILTKAFWGNITRLVEKAAGLELQRRGLPRDTIAVSQAHDANGDPAGVITVRLDRIHTWLDDRTRSLRFVVRVARVNFDIGSILVIADVLPTTPAG